MRLRHAPVTLGSPRFVTFDAGPFRITEAWFAPGAVLDQHRHDRPILAVVLDGSLVTSIRGRRLECTPGMTWSEPCEERHANQIGSRGARVLVTQPEVSDDTPASIRSLLDDIVCQPDPLAVIEARRIAVELTSTDSLTPLVLESLAMLVVSSGARHSGRGNPAPPLWLLRARDQLHDTFPRLPRLEILARGAGVSVWHLTREFRRVFQASVGEYARTLRLDWALRQLAYGDTPISHVALDAGYADQSHMTRACTRATGLPPAEYRRRMRATPVRAISA